MPVKNLPAVVIDTNVLISTLIGKRLRALLVPIRERRFELLFSRETFNELIFVLKRPSFSRYFSRHDIREFTELLKLHARFVEPVEKINVCRDPKDNIFLECAVAGSADYLVTSDSDLLTLNPFQNIPIITPKALLLISNR